MNIKRMTLGMLAAASLLVSATSRAADASALMEPVKSVYEHYLKIQAELAKDSIKGVDEQAAAISKAVRGDDMKMLTPEVAKQADAVGAAKDIKAARTAFKPLSNSLIKYLAANKVPKGTYYEVYCPMAKASWLQGDKKIANPYFGADMLTCGEIKN